MLEKRYRPIHKLLEPINSGNMTGFSGDILVLSPTGPLDLKIWSPTGWKNQQSEGIGLGIVAALEKSCGESTARIMMGHLNGSNPNASGSNPIPIEMENFDRYTSLTSNEPKSIFTTDYYDGDKKRRPYPKKDMNRGDSHKKWRNLGQSCTSANDFREEIPDYPMADFLKSCYLCLRKLHGKDIYMYRGEKAFCSPECRYKQIALDEQKEKCRSEASKPSNISASASPCSGNRLFFTSIVVS